MVGRLIKNNEVGIRKHQLCKGNTSFFSATDAAPAPSPEKAKEDWKRSREEAARQRKRANDLKKTEKEISRLEEDKNAVGIRHRANGLTKNGLILDQHKI